MIIKIKLTVANSQDLTKRTSEIEAVVDSGSYYSWIPKGEAKKIDLKEIGKRKFRTISGEIVERPYGVGVFSVDGATGGSEVVFAEERDGIVLGAITMESMGIKIDPRSGSISTEDVFLAY